VVTKFVYKVTDFGTINSSRVFHMVYFEMCGAQVYTKNSFIQNKLCIVLAV